MGGEAGSRSAACATAHVRSEEAGGALVVSLHRPPLNVLDLPTIRALQAALVPLPARRDLKALVLRSGIEGVFSAGVDVRDHALEREAERIYREDVLPSEDVEEGVRAFLRKRRPRWRDRRCAPS